jgi:hypothetical protein
MKIKQFLKSILLVFSNARPRFWALLTLLPNDSSGLSLPLGVHSIEQIEIKHCASLRNEYTTRLIIDFKFNYDCVLTVRAIILRNATTMRVLNKFPPNPKPKNS